MSPEETKVLRLFKEMPWLWRFTSPSVLLCSGATPSWGVEPLRLKTGVDLLSDKPRIDLFGNGSEKQRTEYWLKRKCSQGHELLQLMIVQPHIDQLLDDDVSGRHNIIQEGDQIGLFIESYGFDLEKVQAIVKVESSGGRLDYPNDFRVYRVRKSQPFAAIYNAWLAKNEQKL